MQVVTQPSWLKRLKSRKTAFVTDLKFACDLLTAKGRASAEGPVLISANSEGGSKADLIPKGRKTARCRPFLTRVETVQSPDHNSAPAYRLSRIPYPGYGP